MRDRLFMLLTYDTGAGLQEMRRLRLCDIAWIKTVGMTLHGKGRVAALEVMMQRFLENVAG